MRAFKSALWTVIVICLLHGIGYMFGPAISAVFAGVMVVLAAGFLCILSDLP